MSDPRLASPSQHGPGATVHIDPFGGTVDCVSAWLLFGFGLLSALLAMNAFRPPRHQRWSVLAFVNGWLRSELPLHHVVGEAVFVAILVWRGALEARPGWVGLLLVVASWAALVVLAWQARRAGDVVEDALRAGLGDDYPRRFATDLRPADDVGMPWRKLALPFGSRDRRVEKIANVRYAASGRKAKLDIYRPRERSSPRPVLLYIHGGAWVLGDKREQGVPMMTHLAANGWVCVTANYRLSPRATFPDHIVDVKRALAWVQENIADYGGDPEFIAISGGSAGGHLAALAALTAGDPEFQPGFEECDTTVRACVPFYGVYDFTNREGISNGSMGRLLERYVMKATLADAPDRFEAASPMTRVSADAPPFMIVHGTNDTLVPVAEARLFAKLLRAVTRACVVYAEVPGAQHAFEVLPSIRTVHVVRGVERFLSVVYGDWSRAANQRDAERRSV